MQCIYKITFPNGKFYIGQTTNFKSRTANHLQSKGKGQPLLEFEWNNADPESIEVLCECKDQDELNLREVQYIEALKPPLNTLKGGEACQGINHPRALHDEDAYKEVLRLYIETDASYQGISDITGVSYCAVRDIIFRRTHAWLDQHYDPKLLKAAYDRRNPKIVVFDKYNSRHEGDQQRELAKRLNISEVVISHVLSGYTKDSSTGVSLTPHQEVILTTPQGQDIVTNTFLAKEHISELSKYQKSQLLNKFKGSGGWKIKKI